VEAQTNFVSPGVRGTRQHVDEILRFVDAFAEHGARGAGFACGVCDELIRPAHAREILRFLSEFKELIQRGVRSGMVIEIDIAIAVEDYKDVSVFVLSPAGAASPRLLVLTSTSSGVFVVWSVWVPIAPVVSAARRPPPGRGPRSELGCGTQGV